MGASTEESAYAAGLIDGEGSLSLQRRHGKGKWTAIIFQVVNNNEECIKYVHKTLGMGKVYPYEYAEGKISYRLYFFAKEARVLIPILLPFLKAKKNQAKLLLEYFSLVDSLPTQSQERTSRINEIINTIQALNKR